GWMGDWELGIVPWEGGQPWHRVPRAAGAAPASLAVPRARLDGDGSSLGQWEVSLPWQEGSPSCSGHPGPGPAHPHREEFLPKIQPNLAPV
ncbi:unnamed protein product, partial [Coccothraustes coccothraustes]